METIISQDAWWTAAARGIADGDLVELYNDRGTVIAGAVVSDDFMPGVVSIYAGGRPQLDSKGHCNSGLVNFITSTQRASGLSQATTANTPLVSLRKCEDPRGPNMAYDNPAIIEDAQIAAIDDDSLGPDRLYALVHPGAGAGPSGPSWSASHGRPLPLAAGRHRGAAENGACRSAAMDLELLSDGRLFRISQPLGAGARGCPLAPGALAACSAALQADLAGGCGLLILNRFGKCENEGRGFRDLISAALMAGIPVLTALLDTCAEAWAGFAGGLTCDLPPDRQAILDRAGAVRAGRTGLRRRSIGHRQSCGPVTRQVQAGCARKRRKTASVPSAQIARKYPANAATIAPLRARSP